MLYSSLVSTVKQKMKKELKITSALWKSAVYNQRHRHPHRYASRPDGIADASILLFTNNFGGLHFPRKENDIPPLSQLRYMRVRFTIAVLPEELALLLSLDSLYSRQFPSIPISGTPRLASNF